MEDTELPQSVGEKELSPNPLTPTQDDLCTRMDSLHNLHGLKSKPSDMFRGAVFASDEKKQINPDWLAQAANSLRDILYPFNGKENPKRGEALKQFGSINADSEELGRVFGYLTELAHHGNGKGNIDYGSYTAERFKELMGKFEIAMSEALARQSDVHDEIDSLFNDDNQI